MLNKFQEQDLMGSVEMLEDLKDNGKGDRNCTDLIGVAILRISNLPHPYVKS